MKIIEVLKECRAKSETTSDDAFEQGKAFAYEHCANILDRVVQEIQEEIDKLRADVKNKKLNESVRNDAAAMIVVLEWILGEGQE